MSILNKYIGFQGLFSNVPPKRDIAVMKKIKRIRQHIVDSENRTETSTYIYLISRPT